MGESFQMTFPTKKILTCFLFKLIMSHMKKTKLLGLAPKTSLSSLMGFVVIVAFGLAALRSSSQAWMLAMSGLTLLILLSSVVGACLADGRNRAYWVGFAILGWGHCLLSHSSCFGDDFATPLAHALEQAGDWMHPHEITVDEFADFGPKVTNFVRIGRWMISLLCASIGGLIACVFVSARDGPSVPEGWSVR
jgi:hypothetical protein